MLALKGLVYLVGISTVLVLNSRCVSADDLSILPLPVTEATEEIAYQKLRNMEKNMKDGINKMLNQALPTLLNSNSNGSGIELSSACMGSILKIVGALKKLKTWPFEMMDATGKAAGGTFRGPTSAYGSYQECIDIVIPGFTKKSKTDAGQYCIIQLHPPLPPKSPRIKLRESPFRHINATFKTELMTFMRDNLGVMYSTPFMWGLCVPSSCNNNDLQQVIDLMPEHTGMYAELVSCEVKEPTKYSTLQIVIISLMGFLVLVNIVSTVYDEIMLLRLKNCSEKPTKNGWSSMASVFSMRQNFLQLMKTREEKERSLDALNGVRFLSTTWIVLGHAYLPIDYSMYREIINLEVFASDLSMQVVTNSFLSVSSFIFITGTLLSYTIVKAVDSGRKYNPLVITVRRIWRLLPCLALTVALTFLTPLLGAGPIFKNVTGTFVRKCENDWWRPLTFILNFSNMSENCLPHTWYLSVDMQCLIAALIYFFILFKTKIGGLVFLFLLGTVGNCAVGYITSINDYPPSISFSIIDTDFFSEYLQKSYMKPYVYFSVYATGLSLGTFLARNSAYKINKFVTVLGWMAAITVGVTVTYATHKWNSGGPATQIEAVMYSSMHRNAWALALAWMTLACFCGRGGIVNDILSWSGFQPLVRISYLVYLLHYPYYNVYCANLQGPQDYTNQSVVVNFFGALCISHILAVFARVMYEYPLVKMDIMFFTWLYNRNANGQTNKVPETAISMDKIEAKDNDARDACYDNETFQEKDHGGKMALNGNDTFAIIDKLNEIETGDETGDEKTNENEAARNETNQILNNKNNDEIITKF